MKIVQTIISSIFLIFYFEKGSLFKEDYNVINQVLTEINIYDTIYFRDITVNENIGIYNIHTDTVLDKYISLKEQKEIIIKYQECNKEVFNLNVQKLKLNNTSILPYHETDEIEYETIGGSKPFIGVSKPVYNENANFSIVFLEIKYKSNLRGEGVIYHLHKVSNSWKVIETIRVWVR